MPTKLMREIVRIDEDKCDGCGLCVPSCAEGAIQIIDGKARLVGDNLCDGLGNCLGTCPKDAIIIERREADEFDEEAVAAHTTAASDAPAAAPPRGGCPGAALRKLGARKPAPAATDGADAGPSRLQQWPVQLTLLPPRGELWQDADVLICADCVPFTMPDFHNRLLAGKTIAIGCPKLDDIHAYVEKLTAVFTHNNVKSMTVAHMEAPCCTGILVATQKALEAAGKTDIEIHDVTVGVDGQIHS